MIFPRCLQRAARRCAALAAIVSLAAPACAPRASGPSLLDESFAHALAPASPVEHAMPGRALVVLLAPPAEPTRLTPSVMASLPDGTPIPGAVYRLTPPSLDADPWLGPVGAWHAHAASGGAPSVPSADIWIAALVLPTDSRPASIIINARTVRLVWLDAPSRGPTSTPSATIPPTLEPFLVPVRLDPAHRWRDRILRERLNAPPARDPPLAHPALELLALQTEDRWRAGLQRLRALCGDALHAAAIRTLTAVALDEHRRVFPVWPTDPAANGSLLGALLDESLDARALESRVRAFLAAFPPATAWVHDDAGDPAGVIVGLADLAGSASTASIAWRAAPEPRAELVALPAFGAKEILISGAAEALDARVGAWSTTLPALAMPLPARPPGVTLGPLRADLSLESWRAGVELPANPPAVALLRPALASTGWELFVQCAGVPSSDEIVRLYLGPTARPTHVLRVRPDGAAIDESSLLRVPGVVAAATSEGWSAVIPIPAHAIPSDGSPLRIALERIDAAGRRSAWPRALLPWRTSPGRAAIDLSAWNAP